jgi:hypothetical protein
MDKRIYWLGEFESQGKVFKFGIELSRKRTLRPFTEVYALIEQLAKVGYRFTGVFTFTDRTGKL